MDEGEKGFASVRPTVEMSSKESAVMSKPAFQRASGNALSLSNSMFQTGSGKTVNISSSGLLRAKALLGLDENHDQEHAQKQSTSKELLVSEDSSHLEIRKPSNFCFSSSARVLASSRVKYSPHGSESMTIPDCINTSEPPAVKFQTAGGRSISVSSDALQRARSLLGNLEFDSLSNEAGTSKPPFSVIEGKPSFLPNQKDDFTTPLLHKGIENADHPLRNFTSPPNPSSYKKTSLGKSERLQSGNNLIAQFDAEAAVNSSKRPYNGFTGCRKPPRQSSYSNMDCLETAVLPNSDPPKRSSNMVLADISNTLSIDHIDNKQCFGEKRRLRGISSVSPFKKPRISFVTPLKKSNSSDINGKVSNAHTSSLHRISLLLF